MVIKYLYNSYNLAKKISTSAANHVLFFNGLLDTMPEYDAKLKKDKIDSIFNQHRWYMIGLFEGSDRILYRDLTKTLDEDKRRVYALIKEEKENEKDD